jgi:uncharacterized protein YjbJ (UPF0337 family)
MAHTAQPDCGPAPGIFMPKTTLEPTSPKGITGAAAFECCRVLNNKETAMDWNLIEGNWKQWKGKIIEKWGHLTEDDLDKVAGKLEQLEGKIQERYGMSKDAVKKQIDDWMKTQH